MYFLPLVPLGLLSPCVWPPVVRKPCSSFPLQTSALPLIGLLPGKSPPDNGDAKTEKLAPLCCQSANGILAPHRTFADFLSGVVADAGKQKDALFGELPTDVPQSNRWEVEWEAGCCAINP